MLNRRSFVGVLIAGVPGLMLAPHLTFPAQPDQSGVTATVRLHFADGSVFEFVDVPTQTTDGVNYTLVQDCQMVASSPCEIIGITSEWNLKSLGLNKPFNHSPHVAGLPFRLKNEDTITLQYTGLRFI